MNRTELKFRAKQQLGEGIFKTPWLMALLAGLVYSALIGAASSIIPGVGALIIAGPMAYGFYYVFLKQSRDNQPMDLGDLFKGFTSDFGQNFLLGLMISIFTTLWSLLFIVPGIVKAYSYAMAYYIRIDNPTYGWQECINASKQMMYGHKWELFVLDMSFIGWYIVGMLVFGVGVLWVIPYQEAARAHFYNTLAASQPSVTVSEG